MIFFSKLDDISDIYLYFCVFLVVVVDRQLYHRKVTQLSSKKGRKKKPKILNTLPVGPPAGFTGEDKRAISRRGGENLVTPRRLHDSTKKDH